MREFKKIYTTLLLLVTISSCVKQESTMLGRDAMLFGIEKIDQTKVDYNNQTNGGISATFEQGDQIGIYAFYNNFYYFYSEYQNFAESVVFTNQGLTVDTEGNANYWPHRSWTFSTIYGTAPHTLDCMAYYPFRSGYNLDYVYMYNDKNGAASLKYIYATDNNVNADIDFMTAHTRYDDSDTPENFRSDMLALTNIPLSFTRQTASLNFKVTKPMGYTTDIVVNSVTLHFDAYKDFTLNVAAGAKPSWNNITTGYTLLASKTCSINLTETLWDGIPEAGAIHPVESLLSNDNNFFIPPESKINKIILAITDGEESKTYTWHPHIAPIEANRHYTLNLELDPSRAN